MPVGSTQKCFEQKAWFFERTEHHLKFKPNFVVLYTASDKHQEKLQADSMKKLFH
jgi:hypothetical protein